jgi:succinate-semialdehyde dehydrogenase/glutarate-semialdehyde dehydrogenase
VSATAQDVARERAVLEAVGGELLVGDWRPAAGGATFAVEDPATEQELATVADAAPEDALAALDAAAEAQRSWASVPPRERGELLRRAFEAVHRGGEDLALLITMEMGKPLAEARAEVAYAAEFLRWYAEEAVRVQGHYAMSPDGNGRVLTMRQPVGPCLLVTPWNFPLAMATRKIAPALAAGCTAVLKPAALTPLTSLAFAAVLLECGLPPGVLNVITTRSPRTVFEPLLRDPRARKLSFTGSTEVGRHLAEVAAGQLLRVSMELGGNAPFLVFDDADLDRAVDGAVLAKMRNGGESCIAANRFYAHESVAAEFARRLADRMGALRLGRGTEPGVDAGPLIDARAVAKASELAGDAGDRGAELLTGGEPRPGAGHFFAPTVLSGVADDARIMHEEVFGPVAPVAAFDTEDEAIARANATPYGLVAYVFTQDLDRARRVVEGLDTGMVGLNKGIVSNAAAPFGGVKHSGIGREGGADGILEYLETKYVAVDA